MTLSGATVAAAPSNDDFRPLTAEQAAMFDASPLPVLVLDAEFRTRYVNPATARFGEVDAASLIGAHVWSRYPELEDSIFHHAYRTVLRDGTPQRFEQHNAARDAWSSVFAYPAHGGVVAVLDDISPQRRAARELQEREQALARAQALAAIGSWTWALAGSVNWSAEARRILGTASPEDALDQLEWTRALDGARAGNDFDLMLTVRREDGNVSFLHVLGRVARNDAGAATHVFGTIQDLSDRIRVDEELRRSEKTLRLAQEAANIGSFDRDLRTKQTRWSDQLLRIFGFDPNTFDQRSIGGELRSDIVHPDDREAVRRLYAAAIASGEKQSVRHRIVRPDGDVRHLLSHAMLVRDAKGEPARLVGTALDITDQVRAEEERALVESQIQQAHKLESLGVLAGGIAHDFNNLLVGVLGNASLALLDLDFGTAARRSVEEIEQAAQRAADLTRQLLAYAGKGRFIIESVDASTAVHDMSALLRTAVNRQVSLHFDLSTSLPPIDVDQTQFRQVVMNLVTNASDALGDAPGVVSIHTGTHHLDADYLRSCVPGTSAAPGEHVYVEVRDSGTGMDAATLHRIFDPFYSTKFTGRGLGLAATLGIMRGHSGAVRVYSEVGAGTSFKVHFPSSMRAATPVVSARDSDWRGSGRVMVVDDEPTVRAVTRALLQRRGFEVDEAEDGRAALRLFEATPFAYTLIMLDLTMPGLGGEDTFRAMRATRADQRVLLMSGYSEQDVTQRFVGRGLAGFLQKPFRADELYATIARTLNLR